MTMSLSSSSKVQSDIPPFSENWIVLGCGIVSVDYLATVDAFPKPDEKIRSKSMKVAGGGNTGNALTAAARLGLKPRVISEVANDVLGRNVMTELESDGVDTSYIVKEKLEKTNHQYVDISQCLRKTRTCIHTPGYPRMSPDDLSRLSLLSALDGSHIVYFDGRLHETALIVAEEAWTSFTSIPSALVSILLRLPNVKFVIVTLGEKGCIMLERSTTDARESEEVEIGNLLESLLQKVDGSFAFVFESLTWEAIMMPNLRISSDGIGAISGRLLVGTAERIPVSELIDTTGAGDAFIGAILYGGCWLSSFGCEDWPAMAHQSSPGSVLALIREKETKSAFEKETGEPCNLRKVKESSCRGGGGSGGGEKETGEAGSRWIGTKQGKPGAAGSARKVATEEEEAEEGRKKQRKPDAAGSARGGGGGENETGKARSSRKCKGRGREKLPEVQEQQLLRRSKRREEGNRGSRKVLEVKGEPAAEEGRREPGKPETAGSTREVAAEEGKRGSRELQEVQGKQLPRNRGSQELLEVQGEEDDDDEEEEEKGRRKQGKPGATGNAR
ncbi:hypothetical protein HPP92_025819 [Vanilla planifolia]|uniref:Carbohydrate kinase PfkB domain-containing protein n=2 Tax=Vanilla planifolia TaxID=51239 RepID=A0A835PG25_VANPL|nr:hypothetical protein HPP92_025819 [Vanilla planifolia]